MSARVFIGVFLVSTAEASPVASTPHDLGGDAEAPAWSIGGERLAARVAATDGHHVAIWALGGAPTLVRPLGPPPFDVWGLRWAVGDVVGFIAVGRGGIPRGWFASKFEPGERRAHEIWTVDQVGGALDHLAVGGSTAEDARVAVVATQGREAELHLWAHPSGRLHALTHTPGEIEAHPALAPAGDAIAYAIAGGSPAVVRGVLRSEVVTVPVEVLTDEQERAVAKARKKRVEEPVFTESDVGWSIAEVLRIEAGGEVAGLAWAGPDVVYFERAGATWALRAWDGLRPPRTLADGLELPGVPVATAGPWVAWTAPNDDALHLSRADGSGRRTVPTGLSGPRDVALTVDAAGRMRAAVAGSLPGDVTRRIFVVALDE